MYAFILYKDKDKDKDKDF